MNAYMSFFLSTPEWSWDHIFNNRTGPASLTGSIGNQLLIRSSFYKRSNYTFKEVNSD